MALRGHNPYRSMAAGKGQTAGQGSGVAQPRVASITDRSSLQGQGGMNRTASRTQHGLDPARDGRQAQQLDHTASRQDEALYDEQGQYNPRPLDRFVDREGVRRAVAAKTGRLFDRQGELNGWDKKDVMTQASYLMGNVAQGNTAPRMARQASAQERDDRRRVIAAAAQDPSGEGFAILGQELLLPIKDLVDYEGWARKIYRVRPLAQGELFRIAKDVRASAWVIGQDGQAIESRMYGKYIQPSEFKIASFPTVDIEDLYQMNYDVLDRAQDTARQEIELEEDKRGLALIDTAARAVNTVTTFGTLGVAALEACRLQVEQNRLVVTKFLVNRIDVSDVFTSMAQAIDPVSQRELLLAGYWGNFYGAMVITAAGTGVEQVVPAGQFYAVTDPEYMGEMAIRTELFSEPFNKYPMKELVKGWAFAEIIGFGIPNARACAVAVRA